MVRQELRYTMDATLRMRQHVRDMRDVTGGTGQEGWVRRGGTWCTRQRGRTLGHDGNDKRDRSGGTGQAGYHVRDMMDVKGGVGHDGYDRWGGPRRMCQERRHRMDMAEGQDMGT